MKNSRKQDNSNEQIWKDIRTAWKYYLKPARKALKLNYKQPCYPFLFKGREY